MYVHSRLATSRTDVDPNVVAVWREGELYVALSFPKEFKDRDLLVFRQFEEISNMCTRLPIKPTSMVT